MAEEVVDLDARIKAIEQEKVNGANKADALLAQLKYLKSLKEKESLTEEEVRGAMKFTCYDSLAFCCNLGENGKPCFHRDSVLEALGISPKEFLRIKDDFTDRIVREVMGKRAVEEMSKRGANKT